MKLYESKYKIKEIYPNTYSITDNGIGQVKVYMYLLVGAEKALLIDSGYGLLDLKEIVGSITDKPVVCVCTHGHVDHALGACQFEEAYLHSKDFGVYKRHSDPNFIMSMGTKGLMRQPPARIINNPSYMRLVEQLAKTSHSPLQPLDDIEAFDLGGRIITWRLVPGHTQGSAVFLDQQNAAVFDADSSALGTWLFLQESSPLPEYIRVLDNYTAYLQENHVEHRYVGHSGKALKAKSVQQLRHCAQIAQDNPDKGRKVDSPLGNSRIVSAGGALLFVRR